MRACGQTRVARSDLAGDGPATLEGGLVSLRVGTQARSNAIEPAELWDELTKDLHHHGISVVKVDQPNRQRLQRKGKSDPNQDAGAAQRLRRTVETDVEGQHVALGTASGGIEQHGWRRAEGRQSDRGMDLSVTPA